MNYAKEVANYLGREAELEAAKQGLISRIKRDVDTLVIPEIRDALALCHIAGVFDCRIGQYSTIIAEHKSGAVVQIQLVGGGLVDERGERIKEISQLLEPTTTRLKGMYGLASIEFLSFGSID